MSGIVRKTNQMKAKVYLVLETTSVVPLGGRALRALTAHVIPAFVRTGHS